MAAVISIDGTPDLNVVMITLDRVLIPDGNETYSSFADARGNIVAQKCFAVEKVSEVSISNQYIRVTRELDGDWKLIVPALKRVLNFHFEKFQWLINKNQPFPYHLIQAKFLLNEINMNIYYIDHLYLY